MSRVKVKLGQRSYDIDIGEGTLSSVGRVLRSLGGGTRVAVVTDSNVGPLYGGTVAGSLKSAALPHRVFTVPAGERSKSVEQTQTLWDAFVSFDMDRDSAVVALGGGVVGDLAGFAAATYMRGIRYVQVPTTMLACVDSSVGGKTGIDLEAGKNLVGAFHQPAAVIIDPTTLKTLPERELRAGLAEVIKYGVIMDAGLFKRLETEIGGLAGADPVVTADVITQCCELKAGITSEDERETDRRAILNYGHTVGHALETLAGYERHIHGEAVAVGMVVAARIAEKLGMIGRAVTERLVSLLSRTGLPTTVTGFDPADIIETMRHDKKVRGGKLTLVLLTGIGEVETVKDVKAKVVAEALEESLGG
jgi:3-dehydroquinate synthase